MASYAGTVSNKINRMECVLDLNVFMNQSEIFNKKYHETRAHEIYEKVSSIVGYNKISSLTYNAKGNWLIEMKQKEDAIILNESTFLLSGSNQTISSKIRSDIGLLITIKCDPLIDDHEILTEIKPFISELYSVTHTTYRFDRNLKDGRRLFRIKPSVKLSEIPHTIEIEGIKIALHFAGKSFLCKTCHHSHPPQQRCISQKTIEKIIEAVIEKPSRSIRKRDESVDFKTIQKASENKHMHVSKSFDSKIPLPLPIEPVFEIVKSKKHKREERKQNQTQSEQNELTENETDIEDEEIQSKSDQKIIAKNASLTTPQKKGPKRKPRQRAV